MLNVAVIRQSWRSWWSFSIRPAGPVWLQFLWTILFNTAIAVVLTLIAWGFAGRADPWRMLWVEFRDRPVDRPDDPCAFRRRRISDRPRAHRRVLHGRRVLFFAGIPIIGCLIGYWIGLSLLGVDVGRIVQGAPRVVIAIVTVSIIFSTLWYRYLSGKNRLARGRSRERARARTGRRAAAPGA